MNDLTGKIPFKLPWFIFDINNLQLITAIGTIPGDITDSKKIILTETPIPGRNFSPVTPGGGGNRHISLTIPIIKRNESIGNVLTLKQLERLRNQRGTIFAPRTQFTPQPKVLYYWGTGSVPLEYYVSDVEFVHKGDGWINSLGLPTYTEVKLELVLDEGSFLYRVEEAWREFASYLGLVVGAVDIIRYFQGKRVV